MRLCLNLLLWRRDKFDLSHFITTVSWIYLFRLLGFFKRFHRFFSFQQLFWKWTFQYGTPCILTLAWLSVVKISSWPKWWMKSVWLEQCKCLLSINHLLLLSPIMGQNYFWSSNYIWSGCFFQKHLFLRQLMQNMTSWLDRNSTFIVFLHFCVQKIKPQPEDADCKTIKCRISVKSRCHFLG